ncbi:MAG: hypothetical protein ACE5G6_01935 [Terriglobia bacterium]
MQRKLFWIGVTGISLFCSFTLSFISATLVTILVGALWWWVVYRSGYLS